MLPLVPEVQRSINDHLEYFLAKDVFLFRYIDKEFIDSITPFISCQDSCPHYHLVLLASHDSQIEMRSFTPARQLQSSSSN